MEKHYNIKSRHLNKSGVLQGGQLELWMDKLAEEQFIDTFKNNCSTPVFEKWGLARPIKITDRLRLEINFGKIGNTSVEQICDIYANDKIVGTKKFTNVAINNNFEPISIQKV